MKSRLFCRILALESKFKKSKHLFDTLSKAIISIMQQQRFQNETIIFSEKNASALTVKDFTFMFHKFAKKS